MTAVEGSMLFYQSSAVCDTAPSKQPNHLMELARLDQQMPLPSRAIMTWWRLPDPMTAFRRFRGAKSRSADLR
jgi:hypothetical protein